MGYSVGDHISEWLEGAQWFICSPEDHDRDGTSFWEDAGSEEPWNPQRAKEYGEAPDWDPDEKQQEIMDHWRRFKDAPGNYGYYWVAPDGFFHFHDAILYLYLDLSGDRAKAREVLYSAGLVASP